MKDPTMDQDAMARDFLRAVQVSHRARNPRRRPGLTFWLALGACVFAFLTMVATIVEALQ